MSCGGADILVRGVGSRFSWDPDASEVAAPRPSMDSAEDDRIKSGCLRECGGGEGEGVNAGGGGCIELVSDAGVHVECSTSNDCGVFCRLWFVSLLDAVEGVE